MKLIKMICALMLALHVVAAIVWCQERGSDKNDYGIVAGQIIDPETSKPVKERFFIRFNHVLYKGDYLFNGGMIPPAYPIYDDRFSSLPGRMGYSLISDSNGYFKRKFKSGTYGIILAPENDRSSKYCVEIDPMDPKMSAVNKKRLTFIVKVEKGKITQFAREAILGGHIKANIVDKNGNEININTVFKSDAEIHIGCSFSGLSVFVTQHFNMQEKLSPSLFPGIYEVKLSIGWHAYGNTYIQGNIMVNEKETSEITFVVDLNDPKLKNTLLTN